MSTAPVTINSGTASTSSNLFTYNFYTTALYTSNIISNTTFVTTPDNKNYISIKNYAYNTNTAHVKNNFSGLAEDYVISQIRIYQTAHIVDNLNPAGELFIETVSATTGNITYVCIPLKNTSGNTSNDLDLLIQNYVNGQPDKAPRTLSLNKLIPQQQSPGIFYQLNSTTTPFGSTTTNKIYVMVFHDPISITLTTQNTILSSLGFLFSSFINGTSPKETTYSKVNVSKNSSGDDNIYIQCDGENEKKQVTQDTSSYKMNEKDINEIIITIIICLFFIVVFVFIDGISDPNSEIGLKIYKIFHEPFGIGFVGIIIIIIFSLFISSVITKQSSQMKSAIIMLTILLTALYTLNLNMTSKDKNKKIDEYRSKSGSSFDAAGAIGAAAGAAGAAAGL